MQIAFVHGFDAQSLHKALSALPAGSRIISCYAQGTHHYGWYEPAPVVEVKASAIVAPLPAPVPVPSVETKFKRGK